MAIKLPKEFVDIPLGDLWYYIATADDLTQHAETTDEVRYWVGWHDCIASLLSDLTSKPTLKTYQAFADKFVEFRMEDDIETLGLDED